MATKPTKKAKPKGKEMVTPTGIPLHGPSAVEGQFGPLSAPGVRPPRKVEVAQQKMYQSPRPVGLIQRLLSGRKERVSVERAADGLRLMVIVTSNSYEDREGETLTTRSLKEYVEKAWDGDTFIDKQPYYWWHEDKLPPIGEIVFADMEGPFLIEVAKELNTRISKKAFDYVEAHPEIKWGASHGFDYPESEKTADGTYTKIYKFETSLLPLEAAANPYTLASVVGEKGEMSKDTMFDELMGIPGAAKALRKGVRKVDQTLQKQGLQHKEVKTTRKAAADDVATKYADILKEISEDPQLAQKLMEVIMQHTAGTDDPNGDEMVMQDEMDMDGAPVAADMPVEEMAFEEDEEEKEFGDDEDTDTEEKEQPGYGEMDDSNPRQTPPLVSQAITKQPGTFPKGPVSHQVTTGKNKKSTTKAKASTQGEQILSAIKSIGQRMSLLEQAMGEVAVMDERLKAVEVQRGLIFPRSASNDEATRVDDPKLIAQVKQFDASFDKFWNAEVIE